MCVSCGCNKPNDDHGDPRNITQRQIQDAASAAGTTVREVTANIQRALQ